MARRHGRFASLVFAWLVAFAPAGSALAQGPERSLIAAPDADYYGHDYDILKDADQNLCETACLADNRCQAFTFNTAKGWCFLKEEVGELRAASGTVSGRIATATPAGSEDELRQRTAELAFVAKSTLDEARQFRLGLAQEARDAAAPAGEALWAAADAALARRDFGAASPLYREALRRDPSSARAWLGLTLSSLSFTSDDDEAMQASTALRQPAAINAYLTAGDTKAKAAALDFLAQSMAANEDWKEAIRVWRASLGIEERLDARGRLDAAVAAHGFRIVDNSVDNNAASPRICLNFSEPLSPAVTASETAGDFLSVEGGDTLPVTASGSQICVEGVRHGMRYRLVARKGIPAASGEVLSKAADVSIYVRDRDPSVRLSGNAYVLPAGGDASMPVTTVNTDVVEARLLRIGDRALARTMGASRFLSQMGDYDLDEVKGTDGEAVWSGFVDVKRVANEEVTTAIPVAALRKERRPGVYILAAKAANARSDEDTLATQWFVVTDIGLTSFAGEDGFHVFARSLGSAAPLAGVALELVAVNNEILGTAETDANGHARLAPGLLKGTGGDRPAVLMASGPKAADNPGEAGEDFSFLDMTAAPFDLTDRGVEGREPAGALDVFLTTERGIYRAGDTVHLTALVRDAGGQAVDDLALTGILTRPDGVEDRRLVLRATDAGGLALDLPLPGGAMRGLWRFAVFTDPKQPALATTSLRVEDFAPETIDFDLTLPDGPIDPAAPPPIELAVRYLFGAPAAGLAVSGETVLAAAPGLDAYPGVRFGLADDMPTALRLPFEAEPTGEDGRTRVEPGAFEVPATTKPLTATVQLRVTDAGGRPVERTAARPLLGTAARLGVRPLFDGALGQGGEAGFELLAIGADGARIALNSAQWVLNHVTTDYQWYSANGRWNYEPTRRVARVASGTADLTADAPARLSLPVDWGGYELVLTDPTGAALPVSIAFDAGWSVSARSMETPDILKIALDKPRYRVGDKAVVHVEPRFAGRAQVLVMSERVVAMASADIPLGGGDVTLDVTRDWGPGAYVSAVLYRPMDIAQRQMPGRAMGLAHAGVEPGERALTVAIEAPERIAPRGPVEVGVTLAGVKPGESAFVTLAAVDVGILNITGFAPPSPQDYYFGQRRLGVEIRDLYSRLIDRMQGAPGSVRSGGDAGADGVSPPPMDDLVALFSGVVAVGADGRAHVTLDVPDFNGSLKLMALAWSKTGVGEASADLVVRDPVVAQVSRPLFLSPGDTSRIAIDLNHVDGPAGRVHLALTGAEGTLRIAANEAADLDLAPNGRARLLVPVEALAPGDGALELALTTPDGTVLRKSFALPVRSIQPRTVTKSRFEIAADGGRLRLGSELLTEFQPGTARATLAVTPPGGFDLAGVVAALDQYPYGCTEQLTSRALPLLYLDDTVLAAGLSTKPGGGTDRRERVAAAIKSVLANQDSSGGFGLWAPGSGDLWLDAYVTDFLTRAREAGYDMPDEGFTLALDNLRSQLAYLPDQPDWGKAAYAYYVLARNGRAAIGDLRYTADNEAAGFKTPLAQAQLAAALALYGDRVRAETLFRTAVDAATQGAGDAADRSDYGTVLRDGAAVATLALETGIDGIDLGALTRKVGQERSDKRMTSTQEDVWSLLAAHAQIAAAPPRLAIDGASHEGTYAATLDAGALAPGVAIENRGPVPVAASVTLAGVPVQALPAMSAGYEITRRYYTLDGAEADPAAIAEGERLVAVLDVLPVDTAPARLMIDDPLPAGFAIDNPAILRGGDVAALGFLDLNLEAAHTEFRGDRFLAAVDKPAGSTASLRFAYIVRALSPGEFVHPAASVEDMYRPERRGQTAETRVSVVGPLR
ncbi:alpha-2-macroglobulin family protein [Aureimonas sp. AU12]|uniref:alpha-2-macroglobulin family protein n=1 Tax=Aureimonas sp. AU12 TaxID=1638161 RepID=UPI0009E787CC|nr:alpha-2-macroglobulin family protein [Aureimonas sp. AU12]